MAADWIKVHRALMDSAVWSDEWLVKLWIWCLLKANYKDATFKGTLVKRGQFVTGRNTAADELHVSPSKWYRGMMRLAELGNIEITANSVWTRVTVCNYSTYQDGNGDKRTANEQRMNSQRTADDTTSGQRADTIEEEQEGKNGRSSSLSLSPARDADADEEVAEKTKTGRKATKTARTTSDVMEDLEPAGDDVTLACPPANAQERPPARLRTWPVPEGCSDVIREAVDLWQAFRLAEDGRITPHVRIDLMLQDAWRKGWTDEMIKKSVEFSIAKGAKNWKDPANDFDAPQAVSESPKARGKAARALDSGSNPF